jgi:hypothetical protein
MPIETPRDLRDHVELAIKVEMTTIPAYLYAMYSVADPASEATLLIRSVVAEEMLHAALMANLLLAVGGEPRFNRREMVPDYPTLLPHHIPDLTVRLERCSPEVIRSVFLTIERPGLPEAPVEPDRYETLGQFYHALEDGLRRLDATHDLFAEPRAERQFADPDGYIAPAFDAADSGGLVLVHDLSSALEACEIVIHQGEGVTEDRYADPSHQELTHYAKFLALAEGDIPLGEVLPAVTDPGQYPFPDHVRPVAAFSDALYCYAFVVLDRLLGAGTPARGVIVGSLYRSMMSLIGPTARYLMSLDVGGGEVAGPPFRFHEFTDPDGPEAELSKMAAALVPDHPALVPVAAAIEPV